VRDVAPEAAPSWCSLLLALAVRPCVVPLFFTTDATRPSFQASCASCDSVHHDPLPAADEGRGTLMKSVPLIESVDLMRFLTRACVERVMRVQCA
jgi:hypothetical protein